MAYIPKYKMLDRVIPANRQWPDKVLTKPPVWASVDLRDGNQALPIPMDPPRKLQYFKMLTEIGFKEIEVSFPSASQDDFAFTRKLVEENLIPEDVKISVLTQSREHLIRKTVESLKGVNQAILHLYVPTSDLHGKFVLGQTRDVLLKTAVEGTRMVRDLLGEAGLLGRVGYEFSPEEFTDTDPQFVVDICTAVKETWGKSTPQDFILNLPATVERRPPNQYADMIEWFCENYRYMSETAISIHAHNDQGCAVAASELALLAGATRAEGTIFGHGERTGNLDIAVLALNLESRGIDTGLCFKNMPDIVRIVEANTGIEVHPRHPYAGQLVFTAFSGSHQDAIRKGLERRSEVSEFFEQGWKVPYLHLDPADVGREYERLIRINSQSGKGGIVFVLEKEFGINPPKAMHPAIGRVVQDVMDEQGGEVDSSALEKIFRESFVNISGPYQMSEYSRITSSSGDRLGVNFTWHINGERYELYGQGNGPLSAVANALNSSKLLPEFTLVDFSEQTLGNSEHAVAMAFVGIRGAEGDAMVYGAGEHTNIDRAAVAALVTALNLRYRAEHERA